VPGAAEPAALRLSVNRAAEFDEFGFEFAGEREHGNLEGLENGDWMLEGLSSNCRLLCPKKQATLRLPKPLATLSRRGETHHVR
jgi:hypothetical protein